MPPQTTSEVHAATQSPCKSQAEPPRSPRSATIIATILLAAETAVCTTTTQESSNDAVVVVKAAGVPEMARAPSSLADLDESLRREVCAYLPWRDCLKLKTLNKAWNEATKEVVVVGVLPETPADVVVPAVFLPVPRGTCDDTTLEASLRCQHPSKWRCAVCGFCNSETRILCGNRACQIPCSTHRDCARLFLGQLRREGTVPFLKWLVENVFGSPERPVAIVNVENHRQLATSRGKGCAWVYLSHRSMADSVLVHHHRVFLDVDPVTQREGVWIVDAGAQEALLDATKVLGYTRGRNLVLPRNALVVEYPSRQPNQPWPDMVAAGKASTQLPPPPVYSAATPEMNWYPGTDTPPSDDMNEQPASQSQEMPSPANTTRRRRNQPYGTASNPSWTPTAAASPTHPPEAADFMDLQQQAYEMPPEYAAYYGFYGAPVYSGSWYAQSHYATPAPQYYGASNY